MTRNETLCKSIIGFLMNHEIDEDVLRILLDKFKVNIKDLESVMVELMQHYYPTTAEISNE